MMTTPPVASTTTTRVPRPHDDRNPWLLWRPETPAQAEVLTVAELSECCCPDLCDRDHVNE